MFLIPQKKTQLDLTQIVIEIDSEIARLEQVKVLLTGLPAKETPVRPKAAAKTGRRPMSAAARKRISEAQKQRWAEKKK